MTMSARSIKDAIKVLQTYFAGTNCPSSLPPKCRQALRSFVEDLPSKYGEEEALHANAELKEFWQRYVASSPRKFGAFAGVLKELRSAVTARGTAWPWWHSTLRPVIIDATYDAGAVRDATDYLFETMASCAVVGDETAMTSVDISQRLCRELLVIYVAHTSSAEPDNQQSNSDRSRVARQAEDILVAFGRRRPKDLFHAIDDLLVPAKTRLQALNLLSSFLQHQAPHLYLVLNTPLVQHLLKCLMNDTSTTLLSVALTCLIMLLPHIPGSLAPHLPRMFLIYSRLLAWEKFSPTSTEAQKTLVTDDRAPAKSTANDPGDIGIDPTWDKARPTEDAVEVSTPYLLTYFTYLYGLYPLNFMSYIRKPRRYLKNIDFPGADAFDLDQAVIRKRSDQFTQIHLLHPNFYNSTIEEELDDPKWPKMDPADVVGECHSLCVTQPSAHVSPTRPSAGAKANWPAEGWASVERNVHQEQLSPSVSHFSIRSGESPSVKPSETDITALASPTLENTTQITPSTPIADSFHSAQEKQDTAPRTDVAFLHHQLTVLRNDLNFERWHKAQYSQHISQLMRRNVKDATIEAETLNLINANKVLRRQIDQLRKAREATIKDSALTRKQASSLEADVNERLNRLKKEQHTWRSDATELQRLRAEVPQLRDLLSQAESKGLEMAHELQLTQEDLEHLLGTRERLEKVQRKLATLEYRQWEFDVAVRQKEISEKEMLKIEARQSQSNCNIDEQGRHDSQIAGIKSSAAQTPLANNTISTKAPYVRLLRQVAAHSPQDELVWHPAAGLTWNPAAVSREASGG